MVIVLFLLGQYNIHLEKYICLRVMFEQNPDQYRCSKCHYSSSNHWNHQCIFILQNAHSRQFVVMNRFARASTQQDSLTKGADSSKQRIGKRVFDHREYYVKDTGLTIEQRKHCIIGKLDVWKLLYITCHSNDYCLSSFIQ